MMAPGPEKTSSERNAAQQQFLSLFLQSEREIFRYVAVLVPNLADAEDIVQQTALALWEKFDDYDPSRPFTPWACRFALNKARQWIERRQRWQKLLENGLAEELHQRREALRPEIDRRLACLESCLRKLPEAHRIAVEAYYFRRLSVEAVARETRRTVDASYKLLQRIRESLRQCIETTARQGEETGA
jgi:RNA polymerase sigma-70 factor (ECF subfamily)